MDGYLVNAAAMTFPFLEEAYSEDYDTVKRPSAIRPREKAYQSYLTLFEVSSSIIIHKDQTQIIPSRKLLIDVFKCRREIESAEEKTDRDSFTSHRSAIHNFEFGDRF